GSGPRAVAAIAPPSLVRAGDCLSDGNDAPRLPRGVLTNVSIPFELPSRGAGHLGGASPSYPSQRDSHSKAGGSRWGCEPAHEDAMSRRVLPSPRRLMDRSEP